VKRWFLRAAAVLAFLALVASQTGAFSYWNAFPSGTVRLSRPAIGQRIQLGADELFDHATMSLNGVGVQPTWDPATGSVQYVPPSALPPGNYDVVLEIQVKSTRPGWVFKPVVSRFSFTVAPDAIEEAPGADAEDLLALAHLNSLRAAAGLPLFTYLPSLGQAAHMHARHLALNPTAHGHTEILGTPFATGVQPWDRAGAYGYSGGVAEVVTFSGCAVSAIDCWMATLYHRIPLVYPGNTQLGYGHAGPGCQAGFDKARLAEVINCGPNAEDRTPSRIRYPYPGQTDVPTWWPGGESPDPFRLYPGTPGPVGYTITLTWAGGPKHLDLTSWSLTDAAGTATPVMTFTPENDDFLAGSCNTVALIPYKPLAPDTTYTVRLNGTVDMGAGLQPYAEKWSFATASGQVEWATSGYRYSWQERNDLLTLTFSEGACFRSGVRAYLNDLPLRDVSVSASRNEVTGRLPTGYGRRQATEMLIVTADGEEFVLATFGTGGDGTPIYLGDGSPAAFTPVTVNLGPGASDVVALRHVDGTLMVPETALTGLGARSELVPEIKRTHWSLGRHTGCVTLGSTRAWVDGVRLDLPLPVTREGGVTYIPKVFLDALQGLLQVFRDVKGTWAEGYVTRLVDLGIINGYGDGTFRPNETLTRSAFIKMLVASLELPLLAGDTGGFTDTTGSWVAEKGYLGPAVAAGIVGPLDYPGGCLSPEGNITREEIAVMIVRAMGLGGEAGSRVVPAPDGRTTIGERVFADVGAWQSPGYIAVAVDRGVVKGFQEPDGTYTFRPAASATRAQAAAMISGMLDALTAAGN
jgi:uncharacterized protein YkwD